MLSNTYPHFKPHFELKYLSIEVVSKDTNIKTEIPKQANPIVTLKGVNIIKSLFIR